jgi:hypothetical protein
MALAGLHPGLALGRGPDSRVGDTSVTFAVPQPQADIVSLRWKVHKCEIPRPAGKRSFEWRPKNTVGHINFQHSPERRKAHLNKASGLRMESLEL